MKRIFARRALVAAVVACAQALIARPASAFPNSDAASLSPSCRPDFISADAYFMGGWLNVLSAADLDGDGLPDLVAATYASSATVAVRLANPGGTFGPLIATAGSDYAYGLAVGRFTGDPVPDVVLSAGPGVSLLAGNGDGTFQPPAAISAETLSLILAADLNGDGKLDVVGLRIDYSAIVVLLGNGDGTFQNAVVTTLKQSASPVFAVGDLDGDGIPDLVLTAPGNTHLFPFRGLGDGRFEGLAPIAAGSSPFGPALADLDGDGHLDILVIDGLYVAVLLSNGDGTFQAARDFDAGYPQRILVGDYDGDGIPDVGAFGSEAFTILRGAGDGTLTLGPAYILEGAWSPVAADFGNDGTLDVAAPGPDGIVTVLRNDGGAHFRGVRYSLVGFGVTAAVAGDFDEDGLPDVAAGGGADVAVFLGGGDGGYSRSAAFPQGNLHVSDLVSGDWNGDGHLDLAFVLTDSAGIELLLGRGDGTFAPAPTVPILDGYECQRLVAADFDGDGKQDLAVFYRQGSSGSVVAIFLGNGDATFRPGGSVAFADDQASALLAADWNEDGKPDLAVLIYGPSNSLNVLLGNGDGTFQTPVPYDLGNSAFRIATGDLRQSGHLDIVVGRSDWTLAVLPGSGDGTFGAPEYLGVGLYPTGLAIADLNLDGYQDVVIASDGAEVLFGTGGGAFRSPAPYAVGSTFTALTGDVDGNGTPDVIFVSYSIAALMNGALGAKVGSASVLVGSAAVLHASAGGYGPLSYQWRRNGTPLSDGGGVSGATTSTLTIDPAAFTDAASYDVLVTDSCGSTPSSPGSLSVEFADVPLSSIFHDDIITIATAGITAGCGGANYCPASLVTRAQMAVFLLKSEHGSAYLPPACAGVFTDVPCPSPFADWIEQLSNEGVTAGCGNGNYCPDASVTRAQMAVFLLKTKLGSGYVPPPWTPIFNDVPSGAFAADWIDDLYNRSIAGGCSASPLLYCPDNPVNRAQMATFLVNTFAP